MPIQADYCFIGTAENFWGDFDNKLYICVPMGSSSLKTQNEMKL